MPINLYFQQTMKNNLFIHKIQEINSNHDSLTNFLFTKIGYLSIYMFVNYSLVFI